MFLVVDKLNKFISHLESALIIINGSTGNEGSNKKSEPDKKRDI